MDGGVVSVGVVVVVGVVVIVEVVTVVRKATFILEISAHRVFQEIQLGSSAQAEQLYMLLE